MQNPFTLTFGKSPLEPVERPVQTKEIIDTFTAEQINQQMFIITGVRGSCVRIATESHKGAVSLSGVQLFLWKYLKRIHLKAGLWKRSCPYL